LVTIPFAADGCRMGDDWRDEYFTMIEDCRKRDKRLSAWDVDFLESIEEWLDSNRTLTPKQQAKLTEIWEKATEKG
jgi:hypothetical protein